jgi:hypothetical protein
MLELRDALREIGQHPTEEELFMMIAQVRNPELFQAPGPPKLSAQVMGARDGHLRAGTGVECLCPW